MAFRSLLLAGAAALTALLACATPARAVETGVNETLGQTLPTGAKAARLGAGWVRVWASWDATQPERGRYAAHVVDGLNNAVGNLKARGLKVLMVVHRTPAWASGGAGGTAPPSDPGTFGAFMGGLAQRVPGVDAWELWNEPDSAQFFAGMPAQYAAMLRAAYPAIKAAQPQDVVVTGGTNGNDMDFVAALYAHGARGSFDAVGVHTDTACLTNGPSRYYRDERGRVGRFTFSAYREVHAVMTEHGDGAKPIWMTEIGWSTESRRPRSCNVGEKAGRKRLGVSPRRQARFLTAAYRCVAADPFVAVALWFGLQDIRRPGGHGLYRRSGKAKPAARAFRRLRRGIAPRRRRCGGVVDRTPPTIRVLEPSPGHRFAGKLSVRVRAWDNRGGSGIGRIMLAADGEHVRSWGGSGGSIDPWWATADWRPGPHTLTFSVRDYAHNQTTVSVAVEKARRRSRR
jgi:hypothetical protein